MARYFVVRGALALALSLVSFAADAASEDELAQIRAEIRQLKETYEARIRALEERLKQAEARPAPPSTVPAADTPAPTVAAAPAPAVSPRRSGIAAFNPAISVVLQGRYANLS